MQAHQYANLFPMMSEAELKTLIDDMKANGYDTSSPIITYQGMILDGRNRYRAAAEASVIPSTVEYSGDDPLAFVIRHNLNRRHLDETQRGGVASKLANMRQGERSDLLSIDKRSVSMQEAADLLNVGVATVARYRAVAAAAPEMVEKMDSGEITANKAYKEVKAQQKKENRKQEDTIPANTAYNVQSGQVWNCGKHIVICGDAYKIDTQADAIITDPPYGIDYKPDWNKWDGSKSDFNPIIGDKDKFNPAPFLNYKTVLLFGANYYSDLLPLGGWLCWDKRTKEELDDMFGSPFELAWYRSAATTKKSIMIRLLHGGVVNADSVNGNNEKRYHATQKPIELMREIMELLVRKTDVILDPFAGSGTTMLACERLGIKSISIDIDPSNVEIILQRYEKEIGVKPCQA